MSDRRVLSMSEEQYVFLTVNRWKLDVAHASLERAATYKAVFY